MTGLDWGVLFATFCVFGALALSFALILRDLVRDLRVRVEEDRQRGRRAA